MSPKDKPLTSAEAQAKIRRLAREGKVEFASQDTVKLLQPQIDQILDAVGIKSAWISDGSCIGDFRRDEDYQQYVDDIAAKLGVEVSQGDYIMDIAMRLKALEPDA